MTHNIKKTDHVSNIRRENHPFHVWESVQKIPQLLKDCLSSSYELQTGQILEEFRKRKISQVFLLGRGSSYFLTLALKYLLNEVTVFPVECKVTNLFENYLPDSINNHTAVFFHSTSGSSEGDVKVVELAKKLGAYTIGVTDIANSRLAKSVDQVFLGPGGEKFELAATRTYSTALFRMTQLILKLADNQGKRAKVEEYSRDLKKIPGMLEEFIPSFDEKAKSIAAGLDACSQFFVIGYGPNVATADESAMALCQCAGRLAVSYEAENYLHGPIQALNKNMGLIAVANQGPLQERVLRAAMASKTIGATTVVIAPRNLGKLPYADFQIELPDEIPDMLSPIVYMVPMWQVAYQFALMGRGGHPDRLSMDKPEFIKAFKFLTSMDKWVK